MSNIVLTADQKAQYERDGYLVASSFFNPEQIKLLYSLATEDSVMTSNAFDLNDQTGKKTKLTLWFTPGEDTYGLLVRSENLVNSVQALLGEGEVCHFHSKLMQKEPKVGGAWEWHQDYGYWYKNGFLNPDAMISVMVALTEANEQNGCLQVLKGSHKFGRFEHLFAGEQQGADMPFVEYELVLILRGKGKRFVGNHISDYSEGELDFLGPNLPHWFRKDGEEEIGGSLVVHFKEEFLGKDFLQIPEMQKISFLFEKAKAGLHFTGETLKIAAQKMHEMLTLSGIDRLICLFTLLKLLAGSHEYQILSTAEPSAQNDKDNDRLKKVFTYVMDHFKEDISIEDVANIAIMSSSGFCRYFKNRTKKNFSHFVNEIRIGYACKQLMGGNSNVSYVCYNSGFNNISHFNKQFKKIVKSTPYQFKQKYKL